MFNKNEFITELENFMLEEEAKELEITVTGEEEADAPMINSPQKANYFLKVVKSIDEEIASLNQLCDEEIAKTTERVNKFRESQLTPLANQKEYLCKLLRNYVENNLDGKKKSIKLPNGSIGITKQQPLWTYEDEQIISFLKENNIDSLYSVEVKEKLNKSDFKKAVEISKKGEITFKGTIVPGVEVTEREDKFVIK